MLCFLFLVHAALANRVITQVATAAGSSVLEAYLDRNNEYMWKTGFFTKQEADEFMIEATLGLTGIARVNFEKCPKDTNGITTCSDWILFPFAVTYSILSDSKYTDRPGSWIAVQFGYSASNMAGVFADVSRLVYFDSKNITQREVMTTYMITLSTTSNATSFVALDRGVVIGKEHTAYKFADGKVSIGSILDLKS